MSKISFFDWQPKSRIWFWNLYQKLFSGFADPSRIELGPRVFQTLVHTSYTRDPLLSVPTGDRTRISGLKVRNSTIELWRRISLRAWRESNPHLMVNSHLLRPSSYKPIKFSWFRRDSNPNPVIKSHLDWPLSYRTMSYSFNILKTFLFSFNT